MPERSDDIGRLKVIVGPMASGKTTKLIQELERARIANIYLKPEERQSILAIKPTTDVRSKKGVIQSHPVTVLGNNPMTFPAIDIDPEELTYNFLQNEEISSLIENAKVIGIDEGHLFGEDLLVVVDGLLRMGKTVIVAGLDLTFAGEPFPPMDTLLSEADKVIKLTAICALCGSEHGRFSVRFVNGKPAPLTDKTIVIGGVSQEEMEGNVVYKPVCRKCFYKLYPK